MCALSGHITDKTVKVLIDSVLNPPNETGRPIDKVPSRLRELSPSSFDPQVVSIGPIHREDKNLKDFEGTKQRYMNDLLTSLGSPAEQWIRDCTTEVVKSIREIRESYRKLEGTCDNEIELTKMMVIDACFILQFLRKIPEINGEPDLSWRGSSVTYDLVLVENQIPFFILKKIFDCTILKSDPTASLKNLILKLLKLLNVFETNISVSNTTDHDHILGFLEKSYRSTTVHSHELPSSDIHSTVELDRAGVIFKPNEDETWQMAIKFKSPKCACFSWCWGKSTLSLPILRIDNFTDLVLRNLIAYEWSSLRPGYVTSYATAMDMLVDTQEDIAMLIKSKVVVNRLGSNENAANMMNKLCEQLPMRKFYYKRQWQQMDTHYNSYWPKNIAALKRTYFSSPWNIVALFAGIALFALTILQTIYTVNPK